MASTQPLLATLLQCSDGASPRGSSPLVVAAPPSPPPGEGRSDWDSVLAVHRGKILLSAFVAPAVLYLMGLHILGGLVQLALFVLAALGFNMKRRQ